MTPTVAERQAAMWIAGLFLTAVLVQRFSVPGLTTVALLVPLTLLWTAAAWVKGVVVVDRSRLLGWLMVAVCTGGLLLVQLRVVEAAEISVRGWAILLVIWLAFVVRSAERSIAAYTTALHYITNIATGLAVASIAMILIQVAGVPFQDWFGQVVPEFMQLAGFNTTYPIEFGSPIFKSNAFIGLEPSMISAQLGVGVLAALLSGARVWKLVVMVAGLVATVAGSGMIIVILGVLVMLVARGSRRAVAWYIAAFAVVLGAAWFTKLGRLVFDRVGEFQSDSSSTSLRVFQPYRVLYPRWTQDLAGAILGYGPGSSHRFAEEANVADMLVTTPVKIFFEYGLLGGLILGAFVFYCYWGGPSRAFAVSLFVSTWLLQAGLASLIITLPALVTITLWSPRLGAPMESRLSEIRLQSSRRRAPSAISRYAQTGAG
ncbi:hypothetical protein [Mycolicibacterium sp. 120270]|uniref:hypothetical protein n=1 Tax=Mycolicibacterium sp. 120270 TaxID=3090600 RepID=UPI00299DC8B5|nr:hypothetical protein [Mycolicibacterium sp. 120270]MDX1887047.1 hypothetical protein [Mycolicibacterium sp. 120270]